MRNALEDSGAHCVDAATGREGVDAAAAERPDLIVLDLGLPDMDGERVCREIRAWSRAPILVLSVRQLPGEKAALLDAGADDYLTKPFSPVELSARVRALLRRAAATGAESEDGRITSGSLVLDLAARTLTVGSSPVHLTPTEWELLRTLATARGRTLTHRQIFNSVWSGRAHGDAQQHLRVHMAHLRRKIGDDPVRPRHIVTEPGVGYRFDVP